MNAESFSGSCIDNVKDVEFGGLQVVANELPHQQSGHSDDLRVPPRGKPAKANTQRLQTCGTF